MTTPIYTVYKTTITNHMISASPYLKSLKESPLGKTFNDIGFDYY